MQEQEREKRVIAWTQECKDCQGTGLYVGIAERDGAAVICHTCKGKGVQHISREYYEFTGRKRREEVKQVYAAACGIILNPDVTPGGVSYEEFLEDGESPKKIGREIREHTCPAWYWQSVNYDLKPRWDACLGAGRFADCRNFVTKDQCWEKFDQEHADLIEVQNA